MTVQDKDMPVDKPVPWYSSESSFFLSLSKGNVVAENQMLKSAHSASQKKSNNWKWNHTSRSDSKEYIRGRIGVIIFKNLLLPNMPKYKKKTTKKQTAHLKCLRKKVRAVKFSFSFQARKISEMKTWNEAKSTEQLHCDGAVIKNESAPSDVRIQQCCSVKD